jgi:CubicO group peptidase (beta-lactamase class C family)
MNRPILLVIGIMILMHPGNLFAQNPAQSISPDQLNSFIEFEMNRSNICGLSASVIKHGAVVWTGNYGMANVEQNEPVTDSTIFLLYSATKPFTGVAIMQLVEQGLLDLDAPVNNYLPFAVIHPDYPTIPITARMLMSHVAGIKDNWSVINSLYTYLEDPVVSIDSFLTQYLVPGGIWYGENSNFTNQEPGTQFEYSNVGATLAGFLVEAITGQPFNDYCRQHVLQPLDMPGSSFLFSQLDTSLLAMPYGFNGTSYVPSGQITSPVLPAGFLRATRPEVDHFVQCMLQHGTFEGNNILDSSLVATMSTAQYPEVDTMSGLLMGYDYVYQVWGHSGGLNGIKTGVFFNKKEDWGITVLTNGAGNPYQIFFMLEQFARDYAPITVLELASADAKGDGWVIPGEACDLMAGFRNNSSETMEGIRAHLISHDSDIQIINSDIFLPPISASDTVYSGYSPFHFEVAASSQAHQTTLNLEFYQGGQLIGCDSFEIYIGIPHVLLVDDETSMYRSMVQTAGYYRSALEPLDLRTCYWDLNRWQLPGADAVDAVDAIIWFTGLSGGNVLTVQDQTLLSGFMDHGGNLFMTGQHIASDPLAVEFLEQDLHVTDVGLWSGTQMVQGVETNPIGTGLSFFITGGTGSGTQGSPRVVEAVNGGQRVFYYGTDTSEVAAVSFDASMKTGQTNDERDKSGLPYDSGALSGAYKSVFLGFGFEGIADAADRDTLMERIMQWFGPMTGIGEPGIGNNGENGQFKLYPNPASGEVHIQYQTNHEGKVGITIHDLSGRQVFAKNLEHKWAGEYWEHIDLTHFNAGIYICTLHLGEKIQVQKLIKGNH